ncbi:MAG: hypothetical protein A3K19_32600 [Lentisphaerae bacterium RIFOXYB12_FULL_65_16]|nr:MAG: hypothetical protein A3K19_32600 [Lentisphaerae bacterium RIFOXYB12_FULL_65_16]
MLVTQAAFAAETGKLPSLKGVWEGEGTAPTSAQKIVTSLRLEVTRQEGPLLWADDVWRVRDAASDKFTAEWRHDPMLGSLDPAGTKAVLSKEGARFTLRLLDADHVEAGFASARTDGGEDIAYWAVLTRQGAAPLPVAPQAPPVLTGAWRGQPQAAQPAGPITAPLCLDVIRQDGALVWLDDIWVPVDPATGAPSTKELRRDRMMGSFDSSGRKAVVVKANARYSLELLEPDRMLVEFVRIGGKEEAAMAFYALLRRNGTEPEPAATAAPDMRGSWEGESRYAMPSGPVASRFRLEVKRQEGLVLWADDVYYPIDPATGQLQAEAKREPLLGGLRPDGTGGALSKTDARFVFTLLGPDRLLAEFVGMRGKEKVPPMCFYAILDRHRP